MGPGSAAHGVNEEDDLVAVFEGCLEALEEFDVFTVEEDGELFSSYFVFSEVASTSLSRLFGDSVGEALDACAFFEFHGVSVADGLGEFSEYADGYLHGLLSGLVGDKWVCFGWWACRLRAGSSRGVSGYI